MPAPAPWAHTKRTAASPGPVIRKFGAIEPCVLVSAGSLAGPSQAVDPQRRPVSGQRSCGVARKTLSSNYRWIDMATPHFPIAVPWKRQNGAVYWRLFGNAKRTCKWIWGCYMQSSELRAVLFSRPAAPRWSTAHVSVTVTEHSSLRCPSESPRCVPAAPVLSPRQVVSVLRSVPVGSVASRRVAVSSVAYASVGFVASALQASPKLVLAPVLQALKRAVLAKKCARIVERRLAPAAGGPRRRLQ